MPRSCYIQLSAAIDGSLSLSLSSPLLDEENRGRHIRSAANSNNSWLARSHEGRLSKPLQGNLWPLRKRGEKRERERERKGRRKEEEEEKKKSRALAFDRALDRNAERSSLRAGSERPSPNCRKRDTVPPFFRFSFLPPILSLGQGARQMAHECPGCPVCRPRRQTF